LGIGDLWNFIIFEPMLNGLIVLYSILFHNFGLTIVALTIIVRLATMPLTLKQLRATRAMSALQPKLLELQKKYAKDRDKLSQETMGLYREHGVNPMGCLMPMLVQLPIWIALYQSIIRVLAVTPESLHGLSGHLYSLAIVHQTVPLNEHFLWLNLAQPDRTLLLPLLVGGSMWIQQKMMATPSADPRQKSMTNMMQWMMPLMFGFFAIQFPSGLALYWVVSTVIGIVMQYYMAGWGGLRGLAPAARMPKPVPQPIPVTGEEKRIEDAEPGDKRQDSGRGYRARPRAAGRESGAGRSQRSTKGKVRPARHSRRRRS
jgi:YidC/Oxa1 family membrane protein insertase